MTESIRVDALPTRTWAHLGVNDAEVDWDEAAAVLLSDTAVTAQATFADTGLPVSVAENPLASVVLGTGKMLNDFKLLRKMSIN